MKGFPAGSHQKLGEKVKKDYLNVRGTIDFSEEQTFLYEQLREKAVRCFDLYGYQQLRLPLLEEKGLFIKSVGQDTDIVQTQMMKIEGKDIVLRPEATAQIVRYYLQNRLDKKNSFYKFFYIGPMFRGERPQKGRLRQFNHIGVEAVGSESFYIDAEVVKLAVEILDAVGIERKELQINSLGCSQDKLGLAQIIREGLSKEKKKLCSNCQKRIEKNPLRALDCKMQNCKKITASLNLSKRHLCPGCRNHFNNLLKTLDLLGIEYTFNPYLVRGLDYYTNTVFEIISDQLGSQDALGAGGRYNNLFSRLGGVDLPAVGFALGVERVMLALGSLKKPNLFSSVYIARAGRDLDEQAFLILSELRREKISANCDFRNKSLKAQLRYAQKIGASFVLILGQKEVAKQEVILRDMQSSQQEVVGLEGLVSKIKEKFSS